MSLEQIKQKLRPFYVPVIESIYFRRKQRHDPIRIMNSLKTIRYIKKHKCSVSRYGDGEYHIMANSISIGFQNSSAELAQALRDVLIDENSNVLICLPYCVNSTAGMTKKAATFWYNFSLRNYSDLYSLIFQCGKHDYIFGDTNLSRPYMDWKCRWGASIKFSALVSIWRGKDILIVEGEQTRLGVGNDLFQETTSIKRILAPAENAFSCYSKIRGSVIENYHGELVLIALGPTATVLAADLSKEEIQAIDIGHIDIEYEWYLRKLKRKEAIPGKYTNEVGGDHTFVECDDVSYREQIIARITN